ncbi:MAG: hypothetical protein ABI678_27545, partial [Kofleriaceae bacterium]
CPPGEECVFGVCNSIGNHATDPDGAMHGSDGSTSLIDPDGDGIDSAVDNCPDIANPRQANEDGDKFGDACDPCPIDASDTPVDSDGDGVADPCDPHPGVAGDHLLVFEGFADGIPSSWQAVGTATAANGEVTLTTVANNHTALVAPGGPLGNATITASLIVDMQVGTFDSSATLGLPYSPSDDTGIFCELYAPMATSPNNRNISLWDSPAQQERGAANLAWATGVAYKVSLMHTGNNYSCSAAGKTANGATNSSVPASMAAVAVYGANARTQWVMVVGSP